MPPYLAHGDWLVVAPRTTLPYGDDEVMEVVNALHAELLIGHNVTAAALQRALQTPRRGVWLITHGDAEGIMLSDGLLSTNLFLPMLEAAQPELVFLNTCASVHIGLLLQNRLHCSFIANVQDVPDREAFVSGNAIAHAIAAGRGFHDAYLAARPGGNDNLVFLVGKMATDPKPTAVRASDGAATNEDLLAKVYDDLTRLTILIDGDPRYGVVGLYATMQELVKKIERLESRQLLINIIVGVELVMILIFFLTVRALLNGL